MSNHSNGRHSSEAKAAGDRPALAIRGLDSFYGKSQITFDISLDVPAGETTVLLGRNGAGKTTFLMAVSGVVSARAEKLELDGHDISRMPSFKRVRAGLAIVPSGSRAFPNLTVQQNLALAAKVARKGQWQLDHVYDTFPRLKQRRTARASTLSGGERQMLAIGRALVTNPKVLLLDEPSEGLAPIVVKELGAMLRQLAANGLAVVLAEQNYRVAIEAADQVHFVEKGRIAWSGPSENAANPEVLHRYLAV